MSIESLLFETVDRENSFPSSATPTSSQDVLPTSTTADGCRLGCSSAEEATGSGVRKKMTEKKFADFSELSESLKTLQQALDQLCQKPLLQQQEELIELKIKMAACNK